jgi:hypothetical protein
MTIIEQQVVSKYLAPWTYYLVMSLVLLSILVVFVGVPMTHALEDSYKLAELINFKRFPPKKDENQIKKEKELGIVLTRVTGFEIFVHKHVKKFLSIGQTSEAAQDLQAELMHIEEQVAPKDMVTRVNVLRQMMLMIEQLFDERSDHATTLNEQYKIVQLVNYDKTNEEAKRRFEQIHIFSIMKANVTEVKGTASASAQGSKRGNMSHVIEASKESDSEEEKIDFGKSPAQKTKKVNDIWDGLEVEENTLEEEEEDMEFEETKKFSSVNSTTKLKKQKT